MDPFQLRLDFLSLLKRLTANTTTYAAPLQFLTCHLSSSSDLWSCLLDTFPTVRPLNRLNLLYLISSLFTDRSYSTSAVRETYAPLLRRDLEAIVDYLVPEARWEGLVNCDPTLHVVRTWRTERVVGDEMVRNIEARLEQRRTKVQSLGEGERGEWNEQDIIRRVEEDRERHKRQRETHWQLPLTSTVHSVQFGVQPRHLNPFFLPDSHDAASAATATRAQTPQDLDFQEAWESTSDWNEDDYEAIAEENALAPLALQLQSQQQQHLDPVATGMGRGTATRVV
ncbi:hypothetical protein ACQY0O_003976 [Thecaphora frezii]